MCSSRERYLQGVVAIGVSFLRYRLPVLPCTGFPLFLVRACAASHGACGPCQAGRHIPELAKNHQLHLLKDGRIDASRRISTNAERQTAKLRFPIPRRGSGSPGPPTKADKRGKRRAYSDRPTGQHGSDPPISKTFALNSRQQSPRAISTDSVKSPKIPSSASVFGSSSPSKPKPARPR